jgi:cob(I)alamin adenosyltransferase
LLSPSLWPSANEKRAAFAALFLFWTQDKPWAELSYPFGVKIYRPMSIATKTGDSGETALMYGIRVSKTDPRVEAYGTVDELNAALGLVRATTGERIVQEVVLSVQKELIVLMGELAVAEGDRERYLKGGFEVVTAAMVDRLTDVVNDLEINYQVDFKHWATPGHSLSSAALDLARTTCRRAERRVVGLCGDRNYVNPETIRYLNRLSDLLWLFARLIETKTGEKE